MDENTSEEKFPERKGEAYKPSFLRKALFGVRSPVVERTKCEHRLIKCIHSHPIVKLLLDEMERRGCAIDYKRHFTCEFCGPEVTGGYDPQLNQVVVCYNKTPTQKSLQPVLTHELIHMFDYCRTEFDGNNIEHVACSEIRAANLAHCSFLGALVQGHTSIFKIANSHQQCVRERAIASIRAVRPNMTREEALKIVNRVFDRCYNDLEPIGRRLRRGSKDMERAYRERNYFV